MKNSYKQLFFLLFIPLFSFGFKIEDDNITKVKTINKSFTVDLDAVLQTNNSYGNINVYLWDENKISIQVTIKVSGKNENKVTDKLNSIDVAFSSSSSKVSAATTFDSNGKSGNNINLEINYIIKIPKNGNVNLVNKYGDIAIEKLNGTSNIICQYGNVNLGNFTNKANNLSLSYSGNSSINTIEKLNLNSQYSDVEFQTVDQISITGNYNTFNFQNVGALAIASNYTKIYSKSVQKFTCEGNYLTLKLGEIGSAIALDSNYSDISFAATSKTKSISLSANYSNTKIMCPSDWAFDINIDLKYGNFKEDLGLKYSEKSEKNTSKSYSGYNISQGKSTITIKANYGNVQLLNK